MRVTGKHERGRGKSGSKNEYVGNHHKENP